ncbi:glycosyltransferase family 2 protein [Terriglobus sp.]|uniref:glycosyltransferase family 2 protein n=1 Tax=Terriglobus sp. TaxID=1889013 RepID=UPI003B00047F
MNDSSARSSALAEYGSTPEISVLMPIWNSELHLRDAIASVLAQTVSSWELLLIDDGSEDESLHIALEFAELEPDRIHILRHPAGENRGSSASRNLGLRHARGEFLTFLDADDVWLPHCLAVQLRVARTHPEAGMIYCAAERWYDSNPNFDEAALRRADWPDNHIPPIVPHGACTGLLALGALLDWFLVDESKVPCICSTLMRTDVARAVGGFEEQFRGLYDDQVFHAKVALAHPIVAHDAFVARYRRHPASCCSAVANHDALQQAGRERFLQWLTRYRKTLTTISRSNAVEQPQLRFRSRK